MSYAKPKEEEEESESKPKSKKCPRYDDSEAKLTLIQITAKILNREKREHLAPKPLKGPWAKKPPKDVHYQYLGEGASPVTTEDFQKVLILPPQPSSSTEATDYEERISLWLKKLKYTEEKEKKREAEIDKKRFEKRNKHNKDSTKMSDEDKPSTSTSDENKPSTSMSDENKPSTSMSDENKPSPPKMKKPALSIDVEQVRAKLLQNEPLLNEPRSMEEEVEMNQPKPMVDDDGNLIQYDPLGADTPPPSPPSSLPPAIAGNSSADNSNAGQASGSDKANVVQQPQCKDHVFRVPLPLEQVRYWTYKGLYNKMFEFKRPMVRLEQFVFEHVDPQTDPNFYQEWYFNLKNAVHVVAPDTRHMYPPRKYMNAFDSFDQAFSYLNAKHESGDQKGESLLIVHAGVHHLLARTYEFHSRNVIIIGTAYENKPAQQVKLVATMIEQNMDDLFVFHTQKVLIRNITFCTVAGVEEPIDSYLNFDERCIAMIDHCQFLPQANHAIKLADSPRDSDGNVVTKCYFFGANFGVKMMNATTKVTKCTFQNCQVGVFCGEEARGQVSGNVFYKCVRGILAQSFGDVQPIDSVVDRKFPEDPYIFDKLKPHFADNAEPIKSFKEKMLELNGSNGKDIVAPSKPVKGIEITHNVFHSVFVLPAIDILRKAPRFGTSFFLGGNSYINCDHTVSDYSMIYKIINLSDPDLTVQLSAAKSFGYPLEILKTPPLNTLPRSKDEDSIANTIFAITNERIDVEALAKSAVPPMGVDELRLVYYQGQQYRTETEMWFHQKNHDILSQTLNDKALAAGQARFEELISKSNANENLPPMVMPGTISTIMAQIKSDVSRNIDEGSQPGPSRIDMPSTSKGVYAPMEKSSCEDVPMSEQEMADFEKAIYNSIQDQLEKKKARPQDEHSDDSN